MARCKSRVLVCGNSKVTTAARMVDRCDEGELDPLRQLVSANVAGPLVGVGFFATWYVTQSHTRNKAWHGGIARSVVSTGVRDMLLEDDDIDTVTRRSITSGIQVFIGESILRQ